MICPYILNLNILYFYHLFPSNTTLPKPQTNHIYQLLHYAKPYQLISITQLQQPQIMQIINNKIYNNNKMSHQQQISKKIEDLLFESNVHVSTQQDPVNHQNNKSLALDSSFMNSLVLLPQHSIERGIPLPKNMLSADVYYKQPAPQQDQPQHLSKYENQDQPFIQIQKIDHQNLSHNNHMAILQDQDQWLVDQLSLPSNTGKRKKTPENTKNVLRNFGNAQNQYALYNQDAINLVKKQLTHPQIFYHWVRTLRLQNFEQFKAVWGGSEQKHGKIFRRLYKKLCWKFYTEAAIPYVLTSRMRDAKTKVSHLKYVYRFLEGLKNPEDFSYFKKVDK